MLKRLPGYLYMHHMYVASWKPVGGIKDALELEFHGLGATM